MRTLLLLAALGVMLSGPGQAADPKPKDEDEIAGLRKALATAQAQVKALEAEKERWKKEATASEIKARALTARLALLEARLLEVMKQRARLETDPAKGAAETKPAADISGEVKKVDGKLMTLSVGSDAGLVKGNNLEVFRLGTTPRYLGRIRIVEVAPRQSIGQAIGKMTTPVQAGDRVASKVQEK